MTHSALEQGIHAARAGRRQQARALLSQVVKAEPANEQAWLWLSAVVEGDEQKRYCLQRVLGINPHNHAAARGLELLAARTQPDRIPLQATVPTSPGSTSPQSEPTSEPPGPRSAPAALSDSLSDAAEWTAPVPLQDLEQESPSAGRPGWLNLDNILVGLLGTAIVAVVAILAFLIFRNALPPRSSVPGVAQVPSPTAPPPTPTARPSGATSTAAPTSPPTSAPTPLSTATPSSYVPIRSATICLFQPPAGLRVDCFDVIVPEDRSGDPIDAIHLPVAVVHGPGVSRSPYPLVFLQGGPGDSTFVYLTEMFADGDSWFYPLIEGRDLIVFDQRGVGFSEPSLQCQELLEAYGRDVIEGWSPQQRQDGYMAALQECRDRLTRLGANLSTYTTATSAADVVDILDALGYDQADLYGVSYGTRLALAVMRDFPDRVHSAILDSPVPLQTNMYLQAEDLENAALQALFRGCAADAECQVAYPDLEQAYRDVVARFDAAPVSLRFHNVLADGRLHQTTVDSDWLRSAVAWGMRSPDTLAIVPQTIYDAQAEDYSPLAYFLYLQNYAYCGLSLGMFISVECSEEILPLSLEQVEETMEGHSDANIFTSGLDDAALLVSACQEWGSVTAGPYEREPLVSDISTLVLAGQYDPVTPPSLGEAVVKTLSQGYLFEIPGAGHVPSAALQGDCPREIVRAFLADPTQRPDDSCLADIDPSPFVIPAPPENVTLEPFVDRTMGVAGVRPAGWEPGEQGPGYVDRQGWMLDPTRVTVQTAMAPADYWLQHLTTGFLGIGFDEEVQPAGQRQANGLTWNLYTARMFRHPVDIALAEANTRTILVLMVSEPREHDVMYELVFLPMVDAAVEM